MFPQHFLHWIELQRDQVPSFKEYPFNIPCVALLDRLEFHPAVTFIVGENGSGKSTLLEAIAVKWGFNAEGGSRDFGFSSRDTHSDLHQYLKLVRGVQKAKDGFFLRAESFYNLASCLEDLRGSRYGDISLHHQSHGESFWSLFMNRFGAKGFYILDEPEAALSPQRQLAMLVRMHDLVKQDSQFIIATHSPILMAYPDACIYQLTDGKYARVKYEDTEHYQLSRNFLNDPKKFIHELFRGE